MQSVAVEPGVEVDGYWREMVPARAPASALLLGYGGGTVAHLLQRRFGDLPITGVESSTDMLRLAADEFGSGAIAELTLVQADALAFVRDCSQQYDLIVVDLYHAGNVLSAVFDAQFLDQLARLSTREGCLVFNLVRDREARGRLRRLGRRFVLTRQVLVGYNLVVHCQRKMRRRWRAPQ